MIDKQNDIVTVFLSHDIDYSKKGPPLEHIVARKDRFDSTEFSNFEADKVSLYYNIPDLMDMEERAGIRSTLFFRPAYETGDLESYEDDIHELIRRGWEVGLHVNDPVNVIAEKKILETIAKQEIYGCRVHFLRWNKAMYSVLQKLGIKYDSSVCFYKDRLDPENMRFLVWDGILVFPITLMDAYMFTYMKIPEERILSLVSEALKMTREEGNLMTILWHDSSIKMIGGRKYKEVLEYLTSQEFVRIVTGLQAYDICRKNMVKSDD